MANVVTQNLIQALGIDNLPEEEQAKFMAEITRVIYQNITIRVIKELKDEDKEEFNSFLEKNPDDQEGIYNFLKTKLPNLDQIAAEEVEKFQSESMDFANAINEE
jgi:hypothetical protein